MKNAFLLLIALATCSQALYAQHVNWRPANTARHLVSADLRADFGICYGLSYGYSLGAKMPVVLGGEFSSPVGKDLLDDWRLNLNGQTEIWGTEHLSLNVKGGVNVKRYQSSFAHMTQLGAGLSATLGYYRKAWGLGLAAGIDESLATQINNLELKSSYPGIQNGWYKGTGGNLSFALKSQYSFGDFTIFLNLGKIYGQNFTDSPTLPFAMEWSLQRRF